MIKKSFLAILLVLFALSPLMAASAKVTYVKGKVEVNRRGTWVSVKTGDLISESETISTGYQSEARLNYNGTVLAVAALSRVTLETLSSDGEKDKVSIYVDAGATRSKVKRTDNKKIDYTTRTAVAVASVRGTDYVQFANGKTICTEGAVAVFSAKDWQKAVEQETVNEGKPQGSATPNTAAKDISSSSPDNAVVVGAGQTTTFSQVGRPKEVTSQNVAKQTKSLSAVKTAAEKEISRVTNINANEDALRANVTVYVTVEFPNEGGGADEVPYNPTPGIPENQDTVGSN